MTHTVIVNIATVAQPFPAGTTAAGIQVTIAGTAAGSAAISAQKLVAAPYSATFADVPAGDYTATAQAVDSTGAALGAPVSTTFTVAPDAVNVDIPQTITVTVQ